MKYVDIIEYTKLGIAKKVAELISSGADVNEKDSDGNYAVICAATNNDYEIMKLLLDAAARINVTNAAGVTPLYYARKYNGSDMSNLLFHHFS